jgi:caffeoyl-CoA O-methyltransferase
MEFIDEKLLNYCENHSSSENDLLKQLNRDTHVKVSQPRMLSGHLQGRLLSMLSKLITPDYVLEIGTYTGYSALCLAEGLAENGRLISVDANEETSQFAQQYISKSVYSTKIRLQVGDAAKLIPSLPDGMDLVFIDADKKSYSLYFDLVFDKLKPGGIILADNVLWSGKVIENTQDKDTQFIREFNQKVNSDLRVELRDVTHQRWFKCDTKKEVADRQGFNLFTRLVPTSFNSYGKIVIFIIKNTLT